MHNAQYWVQFINHFIKLKKQREFSPINVHNWLYKHTMRISGKIMLLVKIWISHILTEQYRLILRMMWEEEKQYFPLKELKRYPSGHIGVENHNNLDTVEEGNMQDFQLVSYLSASLCIGIVRRKCNPWNLARHCDPCFHFQTEVMEIITGK